MIAVSARGNPLRPARSQLSCIRPACVDQATASLKLSPRPRARSSQFESSCATNSLHLSLWERSARKAIRARGYGLSRVTNPLTPTLSPKGMRERAMPGEPLQSRAGTHKFGSCPLRSESDRTAALPRADANGMDRPRPRPQWLSECVGGLSGEGAPPWLAGPPFTP